MCTCTEEFCPVITEWQYINGCLDVDEETLCTLSLVTCDYCSPATSLCLGRWHCNVVIIDKQERYVYWSGMVYKQSAR